ncbi:MAG TPA: S53 family peptidase [Acidimicrobiales bacterium]|nr:S53 family peptidase [Acidimicrobiales bacterium]
MSDEPSAIPIRGSEHTAPGHERVGDPDAESPATVTVYLRGLEPTPGHLSRQDYAAAHGAAAADVELIRQFAAERGLSADHVDTARRSVRLSGSLGSLAAAFGATVGLYQPPGGDAYRAVVGHLTVPAALDGVVTGVFGLDERPIAQPHFRPRDAGTTAAQYTPPEVATAYGFPAGVTGSGQCAAIIELGGGFREDDLSDYFSSLGISLPAVEAVSVNGGQNAPGKPNGPDGEVMLDIEVLGSVAPGANLAVYFTPNTDQGFIDAVSTAVHDSARNPSVVSISWGGPESTWTEQAMQQMESAFAAAAAMGVTVTVAAGDNGSSDGVNDGLAHVDFPASAPHALACGGTTLQVQGGRIIAETVWNDGAGHGAGGGGISVVFAVPSYQQDADIPPSVNPGGQPGRGVPDVAGDADPETGYVVRVDGQQMTIGGTSAVAPLWAALVVLLNQAIGQPVGFLQPFLYSGGGMAALHPITEGNNGAYSAGPGTGWNACSGLGSPMGQALLLALRGAAPSAGPARVERP